MSENRNKAEAERLLGIAEKLLQSRDFNGTRDFAILAQESEPLLEGSDQLLAVAEVLVSSEKRISNNQHDWYSILQLEHRSDDESVKKQYRRLALLLHPDKNKFPFADQAFKLVADAWAVLSDSGKKSLYDRELGLFSRVELSNSGKLQVRRSQRPSGKKGVEYTRSNSQNGSQNREDQRPKLTSFWTACPYCYVLFEYPRVYENCCLRCQSCQRAFHGALIPTMPPLVPGQEAYYCCWAFFPLGFVAANPDSSGGKNNGATVTSPPGFMNWMPQMFSGAQQQQQEQVGDLNGRAAGSAGGQWGPPRMAKRGGVVNIPSRGGSAQLPAGPRKRGRPRKYPLQM